LISTTFATNLYCFQTNKKAYISVNKQFSIGSFLDWEGHDWVTYLGSQELIAVIRDCASSVAEMPEFHNSGTIGVLHTEILITLYLSHMHLKNIL